MLFTVMPHECHGVLTHLQLDWFSNNLFRLKTKKIWKICITGLLWVESNSIQWIPLTKGQQCGKHFHSMRSSCNCHRFTVWMCFFFAVEARFTEEFPDVESSIIAMALSASRYDEPKARSLIKTMNSPYRSTTYKYVLQKFLTVMLCLRPE